MKKAFIVLWVLWTVPAISENLFDVSDTSILYPFPKRAEDLQSLVPLSDKISPSLFRQILLAGQGYYRDAGQSVFATSARVPILSNALFTNHGADELKDWKITGIRFDPCPGRVKYRSDLDPSQHCRPELRLVSNPVIIQKDLTYRSPDFALHLVYQLATWNRARELFDSLRQLKELGRNFGISTDGKVLYVHPGFAQTGSKRAAFEDALRQLLIQFARPDEFYKVAVTGVTGITPWVFFQGTLEERGGQETFVVTEKLVGGGNSFITFDSPSLSPIPSQLPFDNGLKPGLGFFEPNIVEHRVKLASTKNFQVDAAEAAEFLNLPAVLAADNMYQVTASSAALTNLDVLQLVSNPHFSDLDNTDCASCHLESGITGKFHAPFLGRYQYPLRKGITALTGSWGTDSGHDLAASNVRAFGFFFTRPTVSLRSAFDAGEITWFINKYMLGASDNAIGPGPDCTAVQSQVMECLCWRRRSIN
jgi:hypothetical protein